MSGRVTVREIFVIESSRSAVEGQGAGEGETSGRVRGNVEPEYRVKSGHFGLVFSADLSKTRPQTTERLLIYSHQDEQREKGRYFHLTQSVGHWYSFLIHLVFRDCKNSMSSCNDGDVGNFTPF